MMDSLSVSVLKEILCREGRSLLQYVRDAFPWATAAEHAVPAQITAMIDAEQAAAAALARLLLKHHISLPYVGPYPMNFADVNYVSLDHLVPMLVEHEKRAINHLERDLALLHDASARVEVQKILAIKEKHLKQMETLLSPKVAAAAAH
jgi:hypothetical protein